MTIDTNDLYIRSVEEFGAPPQLGHAVAICHGQLDDGAHWYALRDTGLGSSEASTPMLCNRHESPLGLWRKKQYGDDFKGNRHTRRGHLLEPLALEVFTEETGHPVESVKWRWRHPMFPWIQCELDGWTPANGGAPVECKAPGPRVCTDMERLRDGLPVFPAGSVAGYVMQLHHQMFIFGSDHGWLSILPGGRDEIVVRVDFQPELWDVIFEAERAFWVDNCLGGIEPDVIDLDFDSIRKEWRLEHDEALEIESEDAKFTALFEQLDAAEEARKALGQEYGAAKKASDTYKARIELRASIYGAKKLLIPTPGGLRKVTRTQKASFDSAGLKAQHPKIHAQFAGLGNPYSTIS